MGFLGSLGKALVGAGKGAAGAIGGGKAGILGGALSGAISSFGKGGDKSPAAGGGPAVGGNHMPSGANREAFRKIRTTRSMRGRR